MSALALSHPDSTPVPQTVNFCQARFAFGQLEAFLTSDQANLQSEAHVEEQIQQRGREILRPGMSRSEEGGDEGLGHCC
jgi:hypothetical protein